MKVIRKLLGYSLFWFSFFQLSRIIFLSYNIRNTGQLCFKEIAGSFSHGILLDISLMGYILFFFIILLLLFYWVPPKIIKPFFLVFTTLLLIVFGILLWVDVELYKNWGFHVDSTIFLYLKTPKESLASTPVWLTTLLILSAILTIGFFLFLYYYFFHHKWNRIFPLNWYYIPVLLLMLGLLIIPIRGGLGIAPINVGRVFFSSKTYANHAAINLQWNFFKSLTENNKQNSTRFMTDEEANKQFVNLLASNPTQHKSVLDTLRPNIIIIILESFTANVIEPLGGTPNATPNFSAWARKGILFEKMYASGDRSDKGIVSILSGYPAQPNTSIIKYTKKSEKLPQLSKILKNIGYYTSFYYGGEINFANMNSYFMSGNYDKLITLPEFPKETRNSKWGAHDEYVFNRMFEDISKTKEPFFNVLFTLSSHDPFDVPHKSQFSGIDWNLKYLNAIHYTDSCLNNFLNKASQTDWWNHTWVILVADHGIMYPRQIENHAPKKFHIPMVWTGGALAVRDSIISTVVSQTDIPFMMLNQMQIITEEFPFSKDALTRFSNSFAYYAYNNGFGFITDSSTFVWDFNNQKCISNQNTDSLTLWKGQAFYQKLIQDFQNK